MTILKPKKKKGPPKMLKKKKAPPARRVKKTTTTTKTKKTTTSTSTASTSSDSRQEERARRAAELESKASHSWEERKTIDNMPYYYNTKTEALTWDKPDALKSRDSLKAKAADWCWVQDDDEGWIPKCGKGEWMFAKSELKRLEQDIVMLDHINEAQIVRVFLHGFTSFPSHNIIIYHEFTNTLQFFFRYITFENDTRKIRSIRGVVLPRQFSSQSILSSHCPCTRQL